MKTKTFTQSFADVYRLGKADIKPLGAKLGKLMEEVGELAECVNIHQGFITHKTMKEPLVGEVADVVQCALAILVDSYPELSKKEAMDLFMEHFERKNGKWETVQDGDAERARIAHLESLPRAEESFRPESPPIDIAQRVRKIVGEQLGIHISSVHPEDNFVNDMGADSLDLVELVMAIEDEFECEISDRDVEGLFTVRDAIDYMNKRYGVVSSAIDEPHFNDFDENAAAVEDETMKSKAMFSPQIREQKHFDPADDYTERSGRYLSLEERMNERTLFSNRKG